MVVFPHAKINIGLNIISKRADGYHDLETIFYPIPVKDTLEIIEAGPSDPPLSFSASGILIDASDNLCTKAFDLLKRDLPQLPPLKMHLHKNIPMGAGLGGGSSDAAAVLLLLNKKFNLHIPDQKLLEYALALGSDCPFFIMSQPALAKGRGEMLSSFPIDLSAYKIMIVNPGIHVNTRNAFAGLNGNFSPAGELEKNIREDIRHWRHSIRNDFEPSVFALHPEIKEIKEKMYEAGAIYSSMSGSGSSVYGIFEKEFPTDIKFPSFWFCQTV